MPPVSVPSVRRRVLAAAFPLLLLAFPSSAEIPASRDKQSRSRQGISAECRKGIFSALMEHAQAPALRPDSQDCAKAWADAETLKERSASGDKGGMFYEDVRAFFRGLGFDEGQIEALIKEAFGEARSNGNPDAGLRAAIPAETDKQVWENAAAIAKALGLPVEDVFPLAGDAAPKQAANALDRPEVSRRGSASPVPPAGALTWERIDSVLDLENAPSGRWERLQYRLAEFIPSLDKPQWKERRFIRESIDLMKSTPEGEEVLRQLIQELSARKVRASVRGRDFQSTAIMVVNGVEQMNGLFGNAGWPDDGPPEYEFSRKFMEMKDRGLARRMFAANTAHEFRHLAAKAQVVREAPDFEVVLRAAFMNEKRARQTGYLVAVRLNDGRRDCDWEDAEKVVQDPDRYWEDLQKEGYPQSLTEPEFLEPAAALQRHGRLLRERISEVQTILDKIHPKVLAAMDILGKQEGLEPALAELRANVESERRIYPRWKERYQGQLEDVRSQAEWVASADAQWLRERLTAAGDSRFFKEQERDFNRDQEALKKLMLEKPLPPSPNRPGMLAWPEFWEKVRRSQKDHPEYWKEFIRKYGKELLER
ncbi:MAG: hypothetical protein WCU88_03565 [Elusimicrobiota bacterium]|jgi:hypothetical protein